MTVFNVDLYEPINPAWTADSIAVTADSIVYTADGGPLVGATEAIYAAINANVLFADIYEPIGSVWTADSTLVTADSNYWTADGGPIEGAKDSTEAEVISIELPVGGGVYYPRPRPRVIIGYGYGILPELGGEAIGTVGIVGHGLTSLPRIVGAATGVIGTTAIAAGAFKGLSIESKCITGTRGNALGTISLQLNGSAIGRHDDDEAAVITFLMAA